MQKETNLSQSLKKLEEIVAEKEQQMREAAAGLEFELAAAHFLHP